MSPSPPRWRPWKLRCSRQKHSAAPDQVRPQPIGDCRGVLDVPPADHRTLAAPPGRRRTMVAGDGADVWPAMVCAVPLVLLLPACVLFRRRSMTVLAVAGWVVLVPIMDLCLPWRPLLHSFAHGRHLRIVTCNTHGSALDLRAMSDFIDATQPDVVAMQEWGEGFVHPPLGAGRWYELTDGEQRIQSRYPVKRMGRSSTVVGARVRDTFRAADARWASPVFQHSPCIATQRDPVGGAVQDLGRRFCGKQQHYPSSAGSHGGAGSRPRRCAIIMAATSTCPATAMLTA